MVNPGSTWGRPAPPYLGTLTELLVGGQLQKRHVIGGLEMIRKPLVRALQSFPFHVNLHAHKHAAVCTKGTHWRLRSAVLCAGERAPHVFQYGDRVSAWCRIMHAHESIPLYPASLSAVWSGFSNKATTLSRNRNGCKALPLVGVAVHAGMPRHLAVVAQNDSESKT